MVDPKKKRAADLSVTIGKIRMKNPITVASGTFGYAEELEGLAELEKLGAIVTKTVTRRAREGNAPPRIAETASGMLNSIGLENIGIDRFTADKIPYLRNIGVPVIVSIGGQKSDEFIELAERLDETEGVSGIEVNISCPNLESKGRGLFSQDAKLTHGLLKKIRKATRLTLITKLTPNVTDITEIAGAAEDAGSDALSLVNTYTGMAVNMHTRRPRLGNVIGGLSGPAIKPLALKAVWDVYNSVNIPIVGMGGVATVEDVIEFMICGASAVAIGSTNFVYPNKYVEIIEGLAYYINSDKKLTINNLIGSLKTQKR